MNKKVNFTTSIFASALAFMFSISLPMVSFAELSDHVIEYTDTSTSTPAAEEAVPVSNVVTYTLPDIKHRTPASIEENNKARAGSSRVYKYIDVTSSYQGYRDRGQVAKGTNNKNTNDTLTFSKSKSVSNVFSVATGFSKSDVSASLGISHTWSETITWSYSAVVGPKQTVYIGYKDWYDCNKLKFTTVTETWVGNSLTPTRSTKTGSGYADAWRYYELYSY